MARTHFFQEDRLTALRELSLRFTAEKVDHDLRGMVSAIERGAEWKPRERLLVAVSHSPHSQRLVRATKRLSFILDSPWVAAHIDNGVSLDEIETQMLDRNLSLARELGAEVITTQDPDIAAGIERLCRQKAVTQIIVGRHPPKYFLGLFERPSLVDRLVIDCKDIDVHVIRQEGVAGKYRKKTKIVRSPITFSSYIFVTCYVALLAYFNFLIEPYIGYKVVGFIFLLGILVQSLFFKIGPVIFGSILSGAIWDYFFIPPVGSFVVSSDEDMVLLVLYFFTAVVTGILANRARENKELLARRETSSLALYEIVREIAGNPSSKKIVHSVKSRLSTILQGRCDIFIKQPDNGLDIEKIFPADAKEKAAVLWVFEKIVKRPGGQQLLCPLQDTYTSRSSAVMR